MSAQNQDSTALSCVPTLSLRLPLTLKLYSQSSLENAYDFYFCGESVDDRLYLVRNDYSQVMPDLALHSGPSRISPIIAGASDSLPSRHIDPDSDIFLWDTRQLKTMRMRTTREGKVAFTFQVEVGVGFERRNEVFSWIRVAKNDEEAGLENGGYRFVRHPSKPRDDVQATVDDMLWPSHDLTNEGQILAILSYGKRWQLPTLSLWWHMCTLRFTHEDILRQIDSSVRRMILITAARLRVLKSKGRDSGWRTREPKPEQPIRSEFSPNFQALEHHR
ncbi:hypothetical protein F4679DRAFT_588456 [Xylaria curta]|nr:hypothetical protein F4679DRAFT_588456 [Xylaria curta]